MKFSTLTGLLVALIVAIYALKPSLFYRATDAISGLFLTRVKQVSNPVVTGKKKKSSQVEGLDQP